MTVIICAIADIECHNPKCREYGCHKEYLNNYHKRKPKYWKGIFKLQEEMGELQQVLGKLCATPDGNHFDKNINLHKKLIEELGDVIAAIRYFQMQNLTSSSEKFKIEERVEAKFRTFVKWNLSGIKK